MSINKHIVSFFSRVSWRKDGDIKSPTLISLAPDEKIEDNTYYADLLEEQVAKRFDNSRNKNIALSGEYGTGKSSIIRKFVQKHEKTAVIISFATLNSANSKSGSVAAHEGFDKNEPAGVHIDDLSLYADTYGPEDRAEANGIQKEIVKQLMFREKSTALPHSKFNRVGTPTPLYGITLTAIILTLGAIFFRAQVWTLFSDSTRVLHIGPGTLKTILFVLVGTIFVSSLYYVITKMIGRLNLDKIGGVGITASFTDSKNYFDDYLDEIIYLFEKKRYEIVVFEDLDRFDNVLIFERLRALNTVLNSADGMSGRPIRFIYAIRDSLFDNETIENPGTSRAKFFDLIIPVVPFLTFENSLKHFKDNMPKSPDLTPGDGVLRIVARHITDMRLIHDICNEYKVFAERLNISKSTLGLKPDNLVAMVVYKNTCPAKFAELKDHDNFLVDIIKEHENQKKYKISVLQTEINERKSEINQSYSYKKKVEELTKTVKNMVDGITQGDGNFNHSLLDSEGSVVDETYFDASFWDKLQNNGADDVVLQIRWVNSPYNQYSHIQKITKKFVENFIGEQVALGELSKTEIIAKNRQIKEKNQTINELRFCSMQEHVYLESNRELGSEFSKSLPDENSMLGEFIRGGYIDDYYLQYYSVYKGSLSRDGLYYRHEFIERGVSDMRRQLADDDIKELLDSLDISYASTPGMFNVDIVDYLIRNQDGKILPKVISALASDEMGAEQLMRAYQESSKPRTGLKALVGTLSKNGLRSIYNAIFTLDDSTRLSLINTAIEQATPDTQYVLNSDAANYLISQLAKIDVLRRPNKDPVVAHLVNAVNLLIETGQRLDLRPLNDEARKMIVKSSLFRINEENLNIAVGRDNFSLDKIRFQLDDGETLYQYLVANIDEYINTLKSSKVGHHSLAGVKGFEKVINDLHIEHDDNLEDIIDLANPTDCIVEDINGIDKDIWAYMLESEHIIVQSSLQNLIEYHNHSKPEKDTVADSHLANYLNLIDGDVWLDKDYDEYDEAPRNGLLRSVMDSSNVNTSAKANFVEALFKSSSQTINIKFIDLQDGDLYGSLLAKGVLADTIESFEYIRSLKWSTKENYLANSSMAQDYLNGLLNIDEINNILLSDNLPARLKIMALDTYKISDGKLNNDAAQAYIKLANKNTKNLGVDILSAIADKLSGHDLMAATNILPESTSVAELKSVFKNSTDVQLQKIASMTRKRLNLEDSVDSRQLLDRLIAKNIIRSYRRNWRGSGLVAEIAG